MSFTIAEARQVLASTPAALRSLLAGLSDAWLEANEGPNTWSPREVVAHLADLEDHDWMVRAGIILQQGESQPFPPVDRERFRKTLAGKSTTQLISTFSRRRARNLKSLDALDLRPADLERKGVHPAFGSVTLEQLLATWTAHDLSHLAQIARVMARRYQETVGPWKEYLRILRTDSHT